MIMEIILNIIEHQYKKVQKKKKKKKNYILKKESDKFFNNGIMCVLSSKFH